MHSYKTLEECIKNKKENEFIFKHNGLAKLNFSVGNIESIRKFQIKKKCDLYEYVDYNSALKVYFYIKINNRKELFSDILNNVLKILGINNNDIIIIQNSSNLYRIIHKYNYVRNFEELNYYLLKFNLYNISLYKEDYLPCTTNIDTNVLIKKSILSESILNDVSGLIKLSDYNEIGKKYKESRYIDSIVFNNINTLFIKSGMGSGKSTQTVKYIKDNDIKSFLILSCRRTLTYTIYDKLKDVGINVDNYMTISNKKIRLSDKLIISPDSICRLDYPLKKFDFIWIDEGVSFMYYTGNYLFIDRNINKQVIQIIEWLITNCNKLLITDADLNEKVIYYYLYFRHINKSNYVIYNNKCNENEYRIIECEDDMIYNIKEDIYSDKPIYICCDTLSKTKDLYNTIMKYDKVKESDVLLYNSESNNASEKMMYDVNDYWNKFKIVIVSPKVIFGVDFNKEYFFKVYGFYKGNTITVRECIQQLHRIRNVIDKKIFIYIKSNKYKFYDNIMQIKYNIEIRNYEYLFFRKSKEICEHIFNSIDYKINKEGYHYVDMKIGLNYLILYCIMDNNKSLNRFKDIFIEEIKNIAIKNIIIK